MVLCLVITQADLKLAQVSPRDSVRMAADLHDTAYWNIGNYDLRPWGVLVDSMRRTLIVTDSTRRLPLETKEWNIICVVDGYFEYTRGKYTTLGVVFHDSLGQTIVAEAPDPRDPTLRKNADAIKELTNVRTLIRYFKGRFGHRSKQMFRILGLPFVDPKTRESSVSPLLQFTTW
jgi:hypothetical protein